MLLRKLARSETDANDTNQCRLTSSYAFKCTLVCANIFRVSLFIILLVKGQHGSISYINKGKTILQTIVFCYIYRDIFVYLSRMHYFNMVRCGGLSHSQSHTHRDNYFLSSSIRALRHRPTMRIEIPSLTFLLI